MSSSPAVSLNLIVKNPDEDANLVKSAIDGSPDAFKELFMKNVSKVNSLCLRISCDTFVAEELTQQVFIKAWEKLKSFKFESKFSSWLHSIAVNEFLMHLRTEKRYSEKVEEMRTEKNISETKVRHDSRIDLEIRATTLYQPVCTVPLHRLLIVSQKNYL